MVLVEISDDVLKQVRETQAILERVKLDGETWVDVPFEKFLEIIIGNGTDQCLHDVDKWLVYSKPIPTS